MADTMMFVDITVYQGRHAMNIWLAERELLVAMWHGGRCNVVYCDGHVVGQDYVIQNHQLYRR